MRKYKQHFDGVEVDLDNPKTYKHLPKDTKELDNAIFREIGKAIVYMDWYPDRKDGYPKRKLKPKMVALEDCSPKYKGNKKKLDINNSGWFQRERVYKLIKNFAEDRGRFWKDKNKNKLWLQEQLFLIDDETENMC